MQTIKHLVQRTRTLLLLRVTLTLALASPDISKTPVPATYLFETINIKYLTEIETFIDFKKSSPSIHPPYDVVTSLNQSTTTSGPLPGHFLNLSTEIRQEILLLTMTEKELLVGIDLRVHLVETSEEKYWWAAKTETSYCCENLSRAQQWRDTFSWAGQYRSLDDVMISRIRRLKSTHSTS